MREFKNPRKSQGGWVQIAVAAVSAFAASRDKKKQSKAEQGMSIEQLRERAEQDRGTISHEANIMEFLRQKQRGEKRKGIENWAHFGKVGKDAYEPLHEFNIVEGDIPQAAPSGPQAPREIPDVRGQGALANWRVS